MTNHKQPAMPAPGEGLFGPGLSKPDANDTVQLDEARRFLEHLDPGARYFTFQTFDDSGDDKKSLLRVLNGTLNQHAAELIRLNNAGAGIFVTINETDGRGRKIENIERVRAVFIDLDGAPLEPVLRHNLQPHIVVGTSPNKWHAFWMVDGMPRDDFTAVQIALIELFKSDPSIKDLPRVMRLPGFIHRKAIPVLVRIQSTHDAAPYPANNFAKAKHQPHISGEKGQAADLDLWLAVEALEVIPPVPHIHGKKYWIIWNEIGMATYCASDGDRRGRDAFIKWTDRYPYEKSFDPEKRWAHYRLYKPNRFTVGTLVFLARLVEPLWYERMMYELMDMTLE
jgi:hypothetical protein